MKDKEFNRAMGQRAKHIRDTMGKSKEIIAGLATMSVPFLNQIESGTRGMSAQYVSGLAYALNVTTDYLINGKEDSKSKRELAVQALESLSDDECEQVRAVLDNVLIAIKMMSKKE